MYLLAGREISDYKSVKFSQSRKDPFRRTVRIGVERQWTRTVGELNHTHGLFRFLVDDCDLIGLIIRGGDDILAVGCDIRVVDLQSVQWKPLDVRKRGCVDNIHSKRRPVDGLIDPSPILTD